MSLVQKTIKQGSWLALFKIIGQIFSWCITIVVARILSPDDYGLMAVSLIIIGYAQIFSEMGLGAAIIQKPEQTEEELSSVFWFGLGCSILLFVVCCLAAYPAGMFFKNPLVVPIMQTVSTTFIFSGLLIVPSSLLRKNLEFKKFGAIDLCVTFVSSLAIFGIALWGGGVWALVFGQIIRSILRVVLIVAVVRWWPMFYFNYHQAKSYLKFGVIVTFSRSLFYVNENSDTFIAGRAWPAPTLGYYSFALQLSKIPMDRIIYFIHQISFPLFSGLQHDKEEFNRVYVNLIKLIATLIFPIYAGGYLLGDDLIRVLLDEQWLPMIILFKYLCLVQIIASLGAINNRVHTSLGRPRWGAWYHGISAVCMPISFYIAVQYHSMEAILVPWFTTYLLINVVWIWVTVKKIGVGVREYFSALSRPLFSTVVMITMIFAASGLLSASGADIGDAAALALKICTGIVGYVGTLWVVDRSFFVNMRNLTRR